MPRLATLSVLAVLLLVAPASAASHGVIVRFESGTSAAQRSALLGSARPAETIPGLGARVVRSDDATALAARLRRSGHVRYAEVDRVLRISAVPNDPLFGQLHGLDEIDAPAGWDLAGLGAFPASGGVKVGVVDTGVRATHQELAGKVVDCDSFVEGSGCADDNGHGTHVAGTIAAAANNGVGIAGVAFNASLSICKALDADGLGYTSDVASCIVDLADKGARVISLSLGGVGTTTLQDAVQYADGAGALLVAAAGNEGDATIEYPAGYDEVVSVAATDAAAQRAEFSNANDDVEVAAPGVDVVSSSNASDSSYETLSGTSMATPHVAGIAAVLFGRDPAQTAAQVRARLDASVDDLGAPGRDPDFGFGRVNLAKAAAG